LDLGLLLQRQLAFQPIQLCLVETFPGFVHFRQCFGHHAQPFLGLSHFPTRLGQQGKEKGFR